jgi:hypothetical protein
MATSETKCKHCHQPIRETHMGRYRNEWEHLDGNSFCDGKSTWAWPEEIVMSEQKEVESPQTAPDVAENRSKEYEHLQTFERAWVDRTLREYDEKVSILTAQIAALHTMLADCYRWSGADPDGNEDWRLAPHAVEEVKRLREESDAEIAALTKQLAERDAVIRQLGTSAAERMYAELELGDKVKALTKQVEENARDASWARTNRPKLAGCEDALRKAEAELTTEHRLNDVLNKENLALVAELATVRGAMAAQDERERNAAERLRMVPGCDWPEDVADEVERLRGELAELRGWAKVTYRVESHGSATGTEAWRKVSIEDSLQDAQERGSYELMRPYCTHVRIVEVTTRERILDEKGE